MKKPLISFHGKQEIKDLKIADLKRHQFLDNLVQGAYYEDKKGCAVTCTMFTPEDLASGDVETDDIHGRYETELGIPRIIARLEDRFFEGMPVANSKNWPLAFIEAIPVGVNLENVWRRFMVWLLVDNAEGVIKFAKNEKTKVAIQNVADAFKRSLTTTVTRDEWLELRRSAYAAYAADTAAYAAYAADTAAYAAYAADTAAADAYADTAAAYAAYAADAADAADAYADTAAAYAAYAYDADADADADARSVRATTKQQRFIAMSEKLIELLKEAE